MMHDIFKKDFELTQHSAARYQKNNRNCQVSTYSLYDAFIERSARFLIPFTGHNVTSNILELPFFISRQSLIFVKS